MNTSLQGNVCPRAAKGRRSAALLLLIACAIFFYTAKSATPSAAQVVGARTDSTGETTKSPGKTMTKSAAAPVETEGAGGPNATLIYAQPYDGRAVESSSKIQGGTYDHEAADDFDLNATITRVVVHGGRGGYNVPPNPVYHGVYVRFYDGAQGRPGALQIEHFLPAGSPGVVFDAANPNTFDITLPSTFNASGRHFLSVQPVFGGSDTWTVLSGNHPIVRGSVWFRRDRAASEPWTESIYAGRLHDMAFDLYGTLLSAPRIDAVSPNPVPRSGLVRITGAYFGARRDGQLTIDGKPSQYIAHWADNLIVAYVPENSTLGAVDVSVTSSGVTGMASLNVTTRPTDGRIRWRFTVAGDYIARRAAIGPDGTVYFDDERGRLYALTPDGGLKWVFQAGLVGARGPVSVGTDGTVYVGGLVPKNPSTSCGSQYTVNVEGIFAVRPDGTQKWLYDKTCDNLLSGPNVGPDGNIHAVTEVFGPGAFALTPEGTLAHAGHGRFGVDGDTGTEIVFGPAAPGQAPTQKYFQYESGGLFGYTLTGQQVFLYPTNAAGITQPVAGQRTGTIYTVPDHQTAGRLFAVSPQGALRWVSPIRPVSNLSIPDAPPSESAVYIVQDRYRLHRVNPEDGSVVWTFIDGEVLFDPVASPDDRLVLMGGRVGMGKPGFFEAVSSDGSQLWKQRLPDEPGLTPYGQVMPSNRARFTADGRTAYIAADVLGDNRTESNPVHSYFYALDTSDGSLPINQPPTVTMTSPARNLEVSRGTRIDVRARVEDDGKVDRVEFFYRQTANTMRLSTVTTPDADGLYSIQFTPTQSGSYSFIAVAYDEAGLSAESGSTIWVTERAPTVSWVSPATESGFTAPASIALVARAADSDGTVVKVEFSSDQIGLLGSATTPDAAGNYQLEWANPPQGRHNLTVVATDNSGISSPAALISVLVWPPATPTPTPTYTIGGAVRDSGGSPQPGVTVTLSGTKSASATTDAAGAYRFENLAGGGNYTVAPSQAGYVFTPAPRSFTSMGASQQADFTRRPAVVTQLSPAADSYVKGATPDANYGATADLQIKRTYTPGAGKGRQAYLRFDTSAVSGPVARATLRVYGRLSALTASNQNIPLAVFPVSTPWGELTLTWNNKPQPNVPAELARVIVPDATPRWYEFDVTNFINSEREAGRPLTGVLLRNMQSGEVGDYYTVVNSREAASNQPQLVIEQ